MSSTPGDSISMANADIGAAFMLTTLAGASTGIGGVLTVFLFGQNSEREGTILACLLGFAGGIMLDIALTDLLPAAVVKNGFVEPNFCFFLGVVLFALIKRLVPEPDLEQLVVVERRRRLSIESGDSGEERRPSSDLAQRAALMKSGIALAIGVTLHNLPEGIAVFLTSLNGLSLGLPLAIAIGLHNVPEGVAIAAPVFSATGSRSMAVKYAFLSGMAEPLGVLLVSTFFPGSVSVRLVQNLLACVAGIMAYLTLSEIIPLALKYGSADNLTSMMFSGMAFMRCTEFLLQNTHPQSD